MANRPKLKTTNEEVNDSKCKLFGGECACIAGPGFVCKDMAARTARRPEQNAHMADYDSLRERIRIDQSRLDAEVADQAQVFLEVCEHHVRVASVRDAAKDLLAKTDASLAKGIRQNLEATKSKVTEAMITDALLLHPARVGAKDDYEQVREAADKWSALRAAFEQRMRMLREVVALYSTNYYNSTTIQAPANVVRDTLAAVARTKMDEDRKARRER